MKLRDHPLMSYRDDVWRTAVPMQYQNEILCLNCFEVFTSEKQIELLRRNGVWSNGSK
jgi:hypothetical protein